MNEYCFTSESVTEGHPDKIADQISDAILDDIMSKDPNGRVACETLVSMGLVFVAGEITTTCYVDIPKVARETIKEAGYVDASWGFNYEDCAVITSINEQSPDIALGVDRHGAGDQGIMIGFAIDETEELMPLPIMLAHKLVRRLAYVRKAGILKFLRPDGKSQVTVVYENGKPKEVSCVIVSAQHDEDVSDKTLKESIIEEVIKPTIQKELLKNPKFFINPTGRFVIGGPQADTGLTGRKIMVDTYGGYCRHGGGCFSGKDATKVDRSATYMARYIAKNIVASGIASKCELQLCYAIGVAEPVAISIDTFNTSKVPEEKILQVVKQEFDLTPQGMIRTLNLTRPIFKQTATYGHFGRNESTFTWEYCDKVDIFKNLL